MDNQDSSRKYWNSPQFRALKSKWYGALKKSGFKDAESSEAYLQDWSRTVFAKRPEYDQSKEEYYRLAGHFLHEHTFRNETERKIWELHQDGISMRNIAKLLRKQRLKVDQNTVFATIKSLAGVMIHQWKLKEKP